MNSSALLDEAAARPDVGDEAVCVAEWERLELRCAISMRPLTDPVRLRSCAHAARCNFEELRQHVARCHTCPLAGCDTALGRTRDVERDTTLRARLLSLPAGTVTVWLKGDEMSLQRAPAGGVVAPAGTGAAPAPSRGRRRGRAFGNGTPERGARSGHADRPKRRVVVVL